MSPILRKMQHFYYLGAHAVPILTHRKKCILLVLGIFLGISINYCLHTIYTSWRARYKWVVIKDYPALKNFRKNEPQDFLIDTPGCYIPNYAKNYTFSKSQSKPLYKNACGVRAIFLDNLGNNSVIFQIDEINMQKYYAKGHDYSCCYKFASLSNIPGPGMDRLSYTSCKKFNNGTQVHLEQEIIIVYCMGTNSYVRRGQMEEVNNALIYEDSYITLKKLYEIQKEPTSNTVTPWNVLMIGLDTMSRTRAFDTMPRTAYYLKKHNWFDYKAYQKVDFNTFPNLMSVLTGMRMSKIYSTCSSGLYKCADFFIWKKYKDAGYKTAYGEDYLKLPDTFCKYGGFNGSPTDHFMRPFYLTGEGRSGKTICARKKPSAQHMLEYILSFVDSYKNNSFFGMFWINSYTHDTTDSPPSYFDKEIVDFFVKLNNFGVFKNTFIFFFSDHGTRFGKMRDPIESYYDERLPMLFLWDPYDFRDEYKEKHSNLKANQGRLITPYDLYITLAQIPRLSVNSNEEIQAEACPRCTSLFKKISANRKCADVGVSELWCSCRNMTKTIPDDNAGVDRSVLSAAEYLKQKRISVKTIPCMKCKPLTLPTVIRSHIYKMDAKVYYVIAFHMSPNKLSYESVVVNDSNSFQVLSVHIISRYNTLGNCVLNNNDRPFCVCDVISNCQPK